MNKPDKVLEAKFDVADFPVGADPSLNFVISSRNYSAEAFLFNYDRLVITFEPVIDNYRNPQYRPGWCSAALRAREVSHVCVKRSKSDWFVEKDIVDLLQKISAFGQKFTSRVTYGASMGGFGALAFADLLGADQVFAFDPQSTLHPPSVPFERFEDRFVSSLKLDFTGPYGSAVGKFTKASEVFIFVDRYCKPDLCHAKLLETPVTRIVNVPFVGHGTATSVGAARCLDLVLDGVVSGTFDVTQFQSRCRIGRRDADRYKADMRERVKNRPKLRAIVDLMLPLKN